jgi:predicted methyltransferase
MRFGVMLTAVAVVAVPLGVVAKSTASPAIVKALANPARADQAGDDVRRHAADVLAFSGVKPGWQVVDFLPGQGYWTRIFTGAVGPSGHVYALWPSVSGDRAKATAAAINGRNLGNVTAAIDPALITLDKPVDLVWTVQNYHDLPNNGRGEAALTAFNAAVFKALKPGGTYVIIDHVAPAGSGLSDTDTLHRIDPAIVKKQVLAAGFTFAGESTALANPKDDHSLKVTDPAIRGVTDQFVYKFRKPLK